MENNIILKSMLNEFVSKNSLSIDEKQKTLVFEKFVSHSLLSNEYYDSYNPDGVSTGQCIGIDSIAIAINDTLIYSLTEAEGFTKGQFDVKFYFIQAKTSNDFDHGSCLKFLSTIYQFFTGQENQQPPELKEFFKIKSHIYEKSAKFRKSESPQINIYYVYTGQGSIQDKNVNTQIDTQVNLIKNIPYISSSVKYYLVDGYSLADLYKESLNRITKNLCFQRHVALPKLRNATAAYLGVAKCKDYIDLLKNQYNQINKGLFYDNVRDYLGANNSVNSDIEETIKTDSRNLFSVLNNGVTIVAKRVIPSGDEFEISGFQVVNGCQTSHVLFNNEAYITDDMYVTVKLIETNDIDLANSVIKATNSQSIVTKEAFATIKPYHKKLEDYFLAMQQYNHKFYYERRPHQFDDDEEIKKYQIVSAPLLIKAFISVVKEEPHKVHFYYGQILKEYNTEQSTLLFSEKHHPGLYFISHLIVTKAKELALQNKLSNWSYHVALLIKKKLGIKLRDTDGLNDEIILKIISNIETGIDSASREVINFVKKQTLSKNENMSPQKTKELIESFYRINSDSSKALISRISDGDYIVSDITINENKISFKYGKEIYTFLYNKNVAKFNKLQKARISIFQGKITQLTKI